MSDGDLKARVGVLLLRSWLVGHTPEQVSLTEEAVKLADSHQDVALGFESREALVEAATFSGFPEKALVAFTWCLAQCDREPERYPDQKILWQYKWVAADLPNFPQVSRGRILDIHEDMEERYRRSGQSLRSVDKIRWLAAMRMGESVRAREYFERSQQSFRDAGSDCEACEQDDLVGYRIFTGDLHGALRDAAPILAGRMTCASVPHVTLASLLLPLLRLGRTEEAVRLQRWGYRLVGGNRKYIDALADHLEFLTLTCNFEQACDLLEDYLGWALQTTDLDDRYQFLGAAALLLRQGAGDLARLRPLRLPAGLPLGEVGERCAPAALGAWVEEAALDLAGRFDARNENDFYRRRLEERLGLFESLGRPVPLE